MTLPSLKNIEDLTLAGLSHERLAEYAYALTCCRFAASVADGDYRRKVVRLCDSKLEKIRSIAGAECGCCLASLPQFQRSDIGRCTVAQLISLYSKADEWYEWRQKNEMEQCTRTFQWRIVNELLNRDDAAPLAQILFLTECLEADNYAHTFALSYALGSRPVPFVPGAYETDELLVDHIKELSQRLNYLSHEELVEIADYIQLEIIGRGKTAEHLALVSAILNTGAPNLKYPAITRELERVTNTLAKSNAKSRLELAPAYYTLWAQTLKSKYLSQFEKTVRHCYFALAAGKTYPDLGVDKENPQSLSHAISFLDDHRQTLRHLSTRYNLDQLLQKYRPMLCGS